MYIPVVNPKKPNNKTISNVTIFMGGVYHPQMVTTLPHYLLRLYDIVLLVDVIAWTPTLGSSVRIDLGWPFLRVGRGPERRHFST